MECPQHLGREMEKVFEQEKSCGACGQIMPIIQVGWVCSEDGVKFNMDGKDLSEVVEQETPLPAKLPKVPPPAKPKGHK